MEKVCRLVDSLVDLRVNGASFAPRTCAGYFRALVLLFLRCRLVLAILQKQLSPLVVLLDICIDRLRKHRLLIDHAANVSFLVQTRADRLALIRVELSIDHLLLMHASLSHELRHLSIQVLALDELSIASKRNVAILLIVKLISIIVLLVPQQVSSTLGYFHLVLLLELLIAAMTPVIHGLIEQDASNLLCVRRLDELLVLLFQILLERLEG
jgi:hypothetical protein